MADMPAAIADVVRFGRLVADSVDLAHDLDRAPSARVRRHLVDRFVVENRAA
jgi:hypothetical protein